MDNLTVVAAVVAVVSGIYFWLNSSRPKNIPPGPPGMNTKITSMFFEWHLYREISRNNTKRQKISLLTFIEPCVLYQILL